MDRKLMRSERCMHEVIMCVVENVPSAQLLLKIGAVCRGTRGIRRYAMKANSMALSCFTLEFRGRFVFSMQGFRAAIRSMMLSHGIDKTEEVIKSQRIALQTGSPPMDIVQHAVKARETLTAFGFLKIAMDTERATRILLETGAIGHVVSWTDLLYVLRPTHQFWSTDHPEYVPMVHRAVVECMKKGGVRIMNGFVNPLNDEARENVVWLAVNVPGFDQWLYPKILDILADLLTDDNHIRRISARRLLCSMVEEVWGERFASDQGTALLRLAEHNFVSLEMKAVVEKIFGIRTVSRRREPGYDPGDDGAKWGVLMRCIGELTAEQVPVSRHVRTGFALRNLLDAMVWRFVDDEDHGRLCDVLRVSTAVRHNGMSTSISEWVEDNSPIDSDEVGRHLLQFVLMCIDVEDIPGTATQELCRLLNDGFCDGVPLLEATGVAANEHQMATLLDGKWDALVKACRRDSFDAGCEVGR
jgi:hypothetical protein